MPGLLQTALRASSRPITRLRLPRKTLSGYWCPDCERVVEPEIGDTKYCPWCKSDVLSPTEVAYLISDMDEESGKSVETSPAIRRIGGKDGNAQR